MSQHGVSDEFESLAMKARIVKKYENGHCGVGLKAA
jgi:hypothetical protein